MLARNDELELFKSEINLCDYAAAVGFVLDRKASSRCSVVMRHLCGDKIVIARTPSRHWVYFNVHGGASEDCGTIIDFVQARQNVSLGGVRKELRSWLGSSTPSKLSSTSSMPIVLEPSEHNAIKVLSNWMRAKQIDNSHPYLVNDRRIPSSLVTNPIFADRFRTDGRSNVLFPHWNNYGELCGYEVKNRQFTGFSPGGAKGLWCSRPRSNDQVMVVAETAIDALSAAAILGIDRKRFFSTAGQISPTQAICIRSAADMMPDKAEIWLAFDNDEGGRKLSQQVQTELRNNPRTIVERFPANAGDDWNDVLCDDRPIPELQFENE